jgi:anti-sigma regulatory factor (Ser/Thr protein kinase)
MNTLNSARSVATSVTHTHPSSPDFTWLASLPHCDSLEMGAYETAPGMARAWLASLLREWSLAEFNDVVALLASELITNAVTETAKLPWPAGRPPVRLWLHAGPGVIVMLVGDAVVAAPVPREAAEDDESGRGLFLVRQLSAQWGFYFTVEFNGKVTRVIIRIP